MKAIPESNRLRLTREQLDDLKEKTCEECRRDLKWPENLIARLKRAIEKGFRSAVQ